MGETVSFTVHKNTREKRQRREVWQNLQKKARDVPKDVDGYALVAFTRNGQEEVVTRTDWFTRDAADAFRLPDMAEQKIRSAIVSK